MGITYGVLIVPALWLIGDDFAYLLRAMVPMMLFFGFGMWVVLKIDQRRNP